MVAANCALNYCRNKRDGLLRKEFSLEKVHSADCGADEAIDQQKLHNILERIFSYLPVRERIILKLNYLYDKTHLDIGKLLKMPTNTVSSIIKRTKEKLRLELKNRVFIVQGSEKTAITHGELRIFFTALSEHKLDEANNRFLYTKKTKLLEVIKETIQYLEEEGIKYTKYSICSYC